MIKSWRRLIHPEIAEARNETDRAAGAFRSHLNALTAGRTGCKLSCFHFLNRTRPWPWFPVALVGLQLHARNPLPPCALRPATSGAYGHPALRCAP